jgi:hypothetical protein
MAVSVREEPQQSREARRLLARRVRARRALYEDLLAGLTAALFVLVVIDPGLGVVAWFGIPLLVAGLAWLLAERALDRRRRGV